VQKNPVYHRNCYRADLKGKGICRGVSIQQVKRRSVKYFKKNNISDCSELKIYYLHVVDGDLEVDNNLQLYL